MNGRRSICHELGETVRDVAVGQNDDKFTH